MLLFYPTKAGHLGFAADDLHDFERALYTAYGSPTDRMLQAWDTQIHTITELFDKLYEMKHARGMMLLEDFGKKLSLCVMSACSVHVGEGFHYHPGFAVKPLGEKMFCL